MPLSKMILRMIVFGLVLRVSEMLLLEGLPWFGNSSSGDYITWLPMTLIEGLQLGLALGIPMALYTGLLHRNSYKPELFRFALVIIGLTISLLLIQLPFHLSYLLDHLGPLSDWIGYLYYEPLLAIFVAIAVAKHLAIGLMSLCAASRYLRDASASFQKSRVQTLA